MAARWGRFLAGTSIATGKFLGRPVAGEWRRDSCAVEQQRGGCLDKGCVAGRAVRGGRDEQDERDKLGGGIESSLHGLTATGTAGDVGRADFSGYQQCSRQSSGLAGPFTEGSRPCVSMYSEG